MQPGQSDDRVAFFFGVLPWLSCSSDRRLDRQVRALPCSTPIVTSWQETVPDSHQTGGGIYDSKSIWHMRLVQACRDP